MSFLFFFYSENSQTTESLLIQMFFFFHGNEEMSQYIDAQQELSEAACRHHAGQNLRSKLLSHQISKLCLISH